jgi:hypothetical protein
MWGPISSRHDHPSPGCRDSGEPGAHKRERLWLWGPDLRCAQYGAWWATTDDDEHYVMSTL